MHFVHKYLQNGTTQLPSQEAALNNWPICKSSWPAHNRMFCVSIAHFKQWGLKEPCYPQWDSLETEHLQKKEAVSMLGPCLVVHPSCSIQTLHPHWFYWSSEWGPQLLLGKIPGIGEAEDTGIHNWGHIWFLVRHKGLGRHHSQTTRTNLNKMKTNNFTWILQRMQVPGQTNVPKTEETDRWLQRIPAYQEQKPLQKLVPE